MYCPDNYDAFVAHEAMRDREREEIERKLPKCSKCGKKIWDDECYEIGDELYCEECIENSKVWTDNYMKE
jgi:formylmethanofuran dehydrogenase subunit E